jgi:hypothetical protein
MGIKETSVHILSACKSRLVSFGHLVWKGSPEEAAKPVPHWFHFPVQIVAAGVIAYWHWWMLPLPNKAVLCLAAVAALMVLAEMRPIHKAIYVVLIIALVATENRAINDDRAKFENDERCRRREENERFNAIASGLKDSIKISQDQFAETARRFGETAATITGGNSFAFVVPTALQTTPNTFPLVLLVRGRYDLMDVHAEIVRLPEPGFGTTEWATRTFSGTNPNIKIARLGNISHRSGVSVPVQIAVSSDGVTEYSINVFARNRTTHESLLVRRGTNNWEYSYKVLDADTFRLLDKSKPEWIAFAALPLK